MKWRYHAVATIRSADLHRPSFQQRLYRWPLLLLPCAVGEAPSWPRRPEAPFVAIGSRPAGWRTTAGATWATCGDRLGVAFGCSFRSEELLVGGLEHVFTFFIFRYIGDAILPTDWFILFRGVGTDPPRRLPFKVTRHIAVECCWHSPFLRVSIIYTIHGPFSIVKCEMRGVAPSDQNINDDKSHWHTNLFVYFSRRIVFLVDLKNHLISRWRRFWLQHFIVAIERHAILYIIKINSRNQFKKYPESW